MAAPFGFHPEALLEFTEATNYYLREASTRVADRFVSSVESAIARLADCPIQWRIVAEPGIRRHVLSRFPFVIYYRWEPEYPRVTVLAVMHCSRKPGSWHERIENHA